METLRPEINLAAAAILFGILQCGVLIYFFRRMPFDKASAYITLFFAILIIIQIESFLNHSGYIIYALHLLNIPSPLQLLLGPLLFHCTLAVVGKETSAPKKLLHYLPFLLYALYCIFFYVQPIEFKYNAYISDFQPSLSFRSVRAFVSNDPLNIQGYVVVEGIVLHLATYTILGLYQIQKHRRNDDKTDARLISWLNLLNGLALLAAIILFLSEGGIINGKVFLKVPLPFHTASLMPPVYVYALSIFLMKDAVLLKVTGDKYQKSALPESLQKKYLSKIQHVLETERPYLDTSFSLHDLAQSTALKPHHISQVINNQLGMNFYDLINSYRIAAAKETLETSYDQPVKIEALAYQVGYKSKSAFFIAFKKLTGTTPAQYRKQVHFVR